MPKTSIGARIDEIVRLERKADAMRAKIAPLDLEVQAKREALFRETKKAELHGARGALGAAAVVEGATVPNVTDQKKLLAFVVRDLKHNQDLLKPGIATAAWRERVNDGKPVPGVVEVKLPPTLRITALKKR